MSNALHVPEPVSTGLKSLIPSIVRTLVPVVVALLVRMGLGDVMDNTTLEYVLTALVTMLYYVVIRVLERYWDQIGWLLGYAKQPVYVKGEVLTVTETKTPPTTVTKVETDQRPDLP